MKWVVVANRSGAGIYKFSKQDGIEILKEYPNPLGRLKSKDMEEDQPGIGRGKNIGSSPHSMTKEKSTHEEAADQFARQLSKDLKLDMVEKPTLQLKIVAESRLMGKIRSHFDEVTLKDRIEWVNKDLANIPQHEWVKLIG